MRAELAVRPGCVPFVAQLLWKIKDNGGREDVIVARQSNEALACLGCTLVASTTVNFPRVRRLRMMV
jgi:hypothetical protein